MSSFCASFSERLPELETPWPRLSFGRKEMRLTSGWRPTEPSRPASSGLWLFCSYRLAPSVHAGRTRVSAALDRSDLAFSVTALAHRLSKWLLRQSVQASRRSPLVDASEPSSSAWRFRLPSSGGRWDWTCAPPNYYPEKETRNSGNFGKDAPCRVKGGEPQPSFVCSLIAGPNLRN